MSNRIEIIAKDYCTSVRDGTHNSPKQVKDGGRPLITTRNLKDGKIDFNKTYNISEEDFLDISKRSKVDKWDVLISMIGTVGEIYLVEKEPNFAIKNLGLLKVGNETDAKWLYYFLKSKIGKDQIKQLLQGSTQQYISLKSLRNIKILVPSIKEEKEFIVKILETIENKIELNKKINLTLDEIAKTLFKSWFENFDPVKNKMQRKSTGLSKEIDNLFPDNLVKKIPKGWVMDKINYHCDIVYGAPFASKKFNEKFKGIPIIRIRDLPSQKSKIFTEEKHPKGVLINKADLLIGMDGEFRTHYWVSDEAWMNQRICKVVPKKNLSVSFLKNSLRKQLQYIELTEVATTVIHLAKSDIDKFELINEQRGVIKKYNEICKPLEESIIKNSVENQTLNKLKDLLLSKLISGKLKIFNLNTIVNNMSN